MAGNEITEEASVEEDGGKKKHSNLAGRLIVKVLVYIVVAMLFVILMIVVSVVTNRVLNSGKRDAQLQQISNEFTINNPVYTYYDQVSDIRTRTADASPRSVTVKIELGYDAASNVNLSEELTQRKPQLTDLFRKYFSIRTAAELSSMNEDRIKEELKNMVNELLQNGKIEEVVFTDFQVLDF